VDRERGIYDASDHIAVLYESHMPAVLVEAAMTVNRAEEQVLSSATRRATVARAVATAVERFCDQPQDREGARTNVPDKVLATADEVIE
jgi:N-acetylmuramoyl-L-alanine amidase